MNHELPDVQAGFRKGRGTRDQIVNIHWITERAREFQKNIYFCLIDYAKAFDCVDHNKLCKILKEMGNTRPPDLPLEKLICRSESNSFMVEKSNKHHFSQVLKSNITKHNISQAYLCTP